MVPYVSVIIPVYNVEKYIERCVKSIQNQTEKNIEIILINDGSKDKSGEICDALALSDSRIKVIHKENEGAGLSRNRGLDIATGEFVSFIDSDDYVDADTYEKMYNAAKEYSADMVMTGIKHIGGVVFCSDETVDVKFDFKNDTVFENDGINELLLGTAGAKPDDATDSKYGFSACKNIYRNEIIQNNNIRFLSERIYASEDMLFLLEFIPKIKKAVGIPGAFYNYCFNGESFSKSFKQGRFEKFKVLIKEIEKRLEVAVNEDEYRIYCDRQIQAQARFAISQEILYAKANRLPKKELKIRLKSICNEDILENALKKYPYYKLSKMQAVLAFAMKYKLINLLIILVYLRERM